MLNREVWLMIREMREKGGYLREIAERVGRGSFGADYAGPGALLKSLLRCHS